MTAAGRDTSVRRASLVLLVILAMGALVRLALWSASPPNNAYDDHLSAIAIWAVGGRPAADACWQCYQPPLYYATSALVLRATSAVSESGLAAWRLVQMTSVVFSLVHLWLSWLILRRVGAWTTGASLCALGLLAFLPRELYTSVFISNDAALSCAVAFAIWLHLRIAERPLTLAGLAAVIGAACLAAWVKQSGLVVAILPVSLALAALAAPRAGLPEPRAGRGALVAVLVLGLALLLADELDKLATTGHWLVSNQHFFDWPKSQAPGTLEAVSFSDLRVAALLREPTLSRATVDSFWTELFARLWFDYEPRFLTPTRAAKLIAGASYLIGLAVGLLWLAGLVRGARAWRCDPVKLPLIAVQLAYLAVPAVQTIRFPHYSSMKATFLLPAASLAVVFVSLGAEWVWRFRALRVAVVSLPVLLTGLAVAQTVLVHRHIAEVLEILQSGQKLWRIPVIW